MRPASGAVGRQRYAAAVPPSLRLGVSERFRSAPGGGRRRLCHGERSTGQCHFAAGGSASGISSERSPGCGWRWPPPAVGTSVREEGGGAQRVCPGKRPGRVAGGSWHAARSGCGSGELLAGRGRDGSASGARARGAQPFYKRRPYSGRGLTTRCSSRGRTSSRWVVRQASGIDGDTSRALHMKAPRS
jgi:hypothetical protein